MSADDNVVPFARSADPLAFAPGVTPFDRTDPLHVRAWNTLFALGRSEQRFAERNNDERRERE